MTSVTAGRAGHGSAKRRNAGARGAARATRQAALESAKDFHSLISDAEALLKSTVDVVGDQAAEARSRLQKSLAQARDRLADDLETLTDHGRDAVPYAEDGRCLERLAEGGPEPAEDEGAAEVVEAQHPPDRYQPEH